MSASACQQGGRARRPGWGQEGGRGWRAGRGAHPGAGGGGEDSWPPQGPTEAALGRRATWLRPSFVKGRWPGRGPALASGCPGLCCLRPTENASW